MGVQRAVRCADRTAAIEREGIGGQNVCPADHRAAEGHAAAAGAERAGKRGRSGIGQMQVAAVGHRAGKVDAACPLADIGGTAALVIDDCRHRGVETWSRCIEIGTAHQRQRKGAADAARQGQVAAAADRAVAGQCDWAAQAGGRRAAVDQSFPRRQSPCR